MSPAIITPREVSNSEAITLAECQRKWLYQYHPGYHLEAVTGNQSFDRGTAVHTILESFFRAYMETYDYDFSVNIAMQKHALMIVEAMGTDMGKVIADLHLPIKQYFINERERILTWEILGVELLLRAPLAFGLEAVGKIDLLIRIKRGPFKGETIPVDHKTCYNFWSEAELEVNSQGPLYTYLVKHNFPDRVVQRVFFNNVRWRIVADKAEMSKIQVLDVPKIYRQNILANHERLSVQVANWHDLPVEDARERATRSPNPYVCKTCTMRKLCRAELLGQDTKSLVANEYRPNSYGYNNPEEN